MICALEEYGASGHPIGNAIFSAGVQQLSEKWLRFKAEGSVRMTNDPDGGGLSGQVSLNGQDGVYHSVALGTRRYLKQHEVHFLPDDGLADESAINVHVAKDGIYAGTISLVVGQRASLARLNGIGTNHLKDAIRSEAVTAIPELKQMGYGCGMVPSRLSHVASIQLWSGIHN